MDLSPYVAELRDSLTAAASLGDESTRRSTAALAAALEPAARMVLLHALSDLAAEVTVQLGNAPAAEPITVDVRLDGRDVRVVTTRATGGSDGARSAADQEFGTHSAGTADDSDATGARSFAEASGDLTRTTVRMFNELKARAERAASEQGVSLNSFISRAVADSVRGEKSRKHGGFGEHRGRRAQESTISGYVQG